MATADITRDDAPSGAGGLWGGVCNRALPGEPGGADVSVGSHSGVLAGIAGVETVAETSGERMGTLGIGALGCWTVIFDPMRPKVDFARRTNNGRDAYPASAQRRAHVWATPIAGKS
jgi:hypothetical protein